MITTIFFDAAGTLFHLPHGVGGPYRDVAHRFGCSLDADILSHAFHTAWGQMPSRPATHQPRPDDDQGWWFTLVGKVLDQCQVPAAQLDRAAYFEALYTEFVQPQVWALFPEVRDVLLRLRPHFRLGLISNFDGRLRPILANLGLEGWFDPIVISSETGADKPDAWIFQRALALAGTTGAEALHAGDDPRSDWEGAKDAGLHVFRLHRPENSLEDLVSEPLVSEGMDRPLLAAARPKSKLSP